MSDFKIPDEWRNDFIEAYIPLIAGVDSVGVYNEKIDGLTTEEVYKVLYFCEISSRKEWLEGMAKFDKPHRDLALRYLNCRGSIVPRLAIPFSVRFRTYRDQLINIIKFLSLFSLTLFVISTYFWINLIVYFLLILSILILLSLYYKSKR
tara:strand:- start:562 stop:1011 length:450 start_codon:yes stop_codon:yes gene_type:complete